MKKSIFTFLMATLLAFNFANAQEEENKGFKGAWWILAAGSYTDSEATDTQTFMLLPAVGTFISPSVTVGGAVGVVNNKVGSADAVNTFVIKPLVRKYWSVTDKFFLFGEANVPLLFSDNFNGYGFNIEPGIDYFIGGKWTIEAKFGRFGYNSIKPDGGDAKGTTSFGFNSFDSQTQEGLGSGMSIGLKYVF
ncbi:hypothetical protein FBALC1_09977 [Flavobacteriales bacterium ALC-1]|nr:hypothetical protein FBALC1_09977 [Flavobacteriales bacterium ALC-1]